ncbi:hypothetical protein [Campylobacter sp. RM12647]|uniref:hypothetical protein n=1 Tax=Campylobacter sp. RM12647 TaxID=2735737 RepID=UPI001D8E5860|nr:hypothetical protein [Campylobacter sp. RM12647]
MKKLLIMILGLVISLNAAIVTKTSIKTATGEGYGLTYEQAVDNALAEAIGKLNGAYIKSTHQNKVQASNNNGDINYQETYNKKISRATQGRFNSFDVISKMQTADGYKVVVQVKKISSNKHYKIPGQNTNKHNLIVVPRISELNMMSIGYEELVFLNTLKTAIQNEIYKARKFNLLDRDNQNITENEARFIKNNASKDEALRLGHTLGADYVFLFDVASFKYIPGKHSSYTNSIGKSKLSATINYQVILMATQEIKYSNTSTIQYEFKELNNVEIDNFINKIAKTMVENFHSGIYPPVVENISNNLAVFTQKIPIGTILDCFAKGKVIIDSRTKEKSYTEDFSGVVEIIRNNEKQSYANISSGNIKKGDICRIKKEEKIKKKVSNGYGL